MERQNGRKILLGLSAAGLLALLYACGEVGGSGQCGGVAGTGACVRIEDIQPSYLDQQPVSNVDAVQDICINDPTDPSDDEPEPFTDHDAIVTISNSPLPGATDVTTDPIVTLQDYSISYTLNYCPFGATCPLLDPLPVAPGQTTTIGPNSSRGIPYPFAQLSKKFEYVGKGGSIFAFPSYTAHYTITGTTTFNEKISLQGFAEFTIGDYNNCP